MYVFGYFYQDSKEDILEQNGSITIAIFGFQK